ncbi:hypothetical protein HOY80DRAFT_1035690 [Tuber brumale]|nr:hypothetical protein HOY80DRAFT_1035690 [Tuber brumale]
MEVIGKCEKRRNSINALDKGSNNSATQDMQKLDFQRHRELSGSHWIKTIATFEKLGQNRSTEAHPKAILQVQSPITLNMFLPASNPKGSFNAVRYGMKGKAQGKLFISSKLAVQNAHTLDGQRAQVLCTSWPISI